MVLPIDRTSTPADGLYNADTNPDEEMTVQRSYTPIHFYYMPTEQGAHDYILWKVNRTFVDRSVTPPPLLGCEPPPFSNLQAADWVLAPASPIPDPVPVSPPTSSAEIEPLSSVFAEFDSWLESHPPDPPSTSSSSPPCEIENTHSSGPSLQKRPRSPEGSPKLSAKKICQGLDNDSKEEMQATTAKTNALAPVCHSTPQPMQSGPVLLIHTLSADAPFPKSKTFPLVPRTETPKKNLSQTKTGIKHTLLTYLENACTHLGTNDGPVSREKLLVDVHQSCLAGFNRFKKIKIGKRYLNQFQKSFSDFVTLIREGKDDLITLISFNLGKVREPETRDPNRFKAVRHRFSLLSSISPTEDPPDVAILKLLDELYVREPNWQQFVSGTFALLKGQIKTEKAFQEIANLLKHSWRFSFFRQTPLDFEDIPHHSCFDELFTFKKFYFGI